MSNRDTIAAPATPAGRGGVAIIRVSGKNVNSLAQNMLGRIPKPRHAQFHSFKDSDGSVIDMGIVLFFPAPHSFTGEDILEFHSHGSPIVVNSLLQRILSFNIRLAKPGEFSERAFLNDKIDLTQAEAIADLIDSASEQAARLAVRSLQGEFSRQIKHLVEELIQLRLFVEAAIDFPEEEIDFLSDGRIAEKLKMTIERILIIKKAAKQGSILREGMSLVIAGSPNAGKSTLLNALSGKETAIVSHIAGTTRDVMREYISVDGIPLHIIDTAGIHESKDEIEREGIRRAWQEIENADRVLLIVDSQQKTVDQVISEFIPKFNGNIPVTIVCNKIDASGIKQHQTNVKDFPVIYLSAKTGEGLENLKTHLKESLGYVPDSEGVFLARTRHIDALEKALGFLKSGEQQLLESKAGELLAEDLRQAQIALGEITGEFTADDLLGMIFSNFCIGK